MSAINQIVSNIAFYKFAAVSDPQELQARFMAHCRSLKLKGTILLAGEGINGMLAGGKAATDEFVGKLHADPRFSDLLVKQSFSEKVPFKRLLIKVKKEILTLRMNQIDPRQKTAPYIRPEELRELLAKGGDVLLIDIRNDFEVGYGTFKGAVNPKTKSFGQFPAFVKEKLAGVPKDQKIITFCTGGIRCEKGTAVLMREGFSNVFQLEGGILNYFEKTKGEFWEGKCFVFDEREALDTSLKPIR